MILILGLLIFIIVVVFILIVLIFIFVTTILLADKSVEGIESRHDFFHAYFKLAAFVFDFHR